jgi:hypothetical protein
MTSWTVKTFSDLSAPNLDIGAYSRLKHGSDVSARILGHEMAEAFVEEKGDFIDDSTGIVVIPAPGTNVPVAATILAKRFVDRFNMILAPHMGVHAEMGHIHRYMSYNMNTYADISAEERQKLLEGDTLHFPETFIAGKSIIFIDDVCITGTHEKKLEKELQKKGLDNARIYASYATYTGADASIEGRLNKVSVKGPLDVVWLAQEPGFTVTVRCLRLLLEADKETLTQVLRGLPRRLREEFTSAAIEKGYYLYPEYKETYGMFLQSVR